MTGQIDCVIFLAKHLLSHTTIHLLVRQLLLANESYTARVQLIFKSVPIRMLFRNKYKVLMAVACSVIDAY